jgi:hypothetical protein
MHECATLNSPVFSINISLALLHSSNYTKISSQVNDVLYLQHWSPRGSLFELPGWCGVTQSVPSACKYSRNVLLMYIILIGNCFLYCLWIWKAPMDTRHCFGLL